LDTRSKIITLAEAAGRVIDTLVVGYFDPVLAAHVTRLQQLGNAVTVSVIDPPEEILPTRARAELVAALACVSQVILGDARPLAKHVIDMTDADLDSRRQLIERIRQR
jgi:hypothetical protein